MYLRYVDPSWDSPETVGAPGRRLAGAGRAATICHAPVERSAALAAVPVVELAGVGLHAINEADTVRVILDELEAGRGGVVVTPNLDHLRRCLTDPHFEALVAEADLVVADGMPLVWASRAQGTPLPERVAGSNLISSLSESAARRGRSVFMLGGAPGTAEGAAKVLQNRFPGLKVAGTYCPPIGFEQNKRIMGELRDVLAASAPDIVYVALGSPKQERLIALLRTALPSAWWLGVGQQLQLPVRPRAARAAVDAAGRARVAPPPVPGAAAAVPAVHHRRRAVRDAADVALVPQRCQQPPGPASATPARAGAADRSAARAQPKRTSPPCPTRIPVCHRAASPAPQNGHPVARPGAVGFDGAVAADVPPARRAAASLDDSGITMLSQVAGTDRMRRAAPMVLRSVGCRACGRSCCSAARCGRAP